MLKVLRFSLILLSIPFLLIAQENDTSIVTPPWKTGLSLGLDFSQLLQINPRQGAGQNRLGAGTAITAFAKYKKKEAGLG